MYILYYCTFYFVLFGVNVLFLQSYKSQYNTCPIFTEYAADRQQHKSSHSSRSIQQLARFLVPVVCVLVYYLVIFCICDHGSMVPFISIIQAYIIIIYSIDI